MINIAVEGESDREAAEAVVRAAGGTVGKVVVARGKTGLDPKIAKYNRASKHASWVVFRDSDSRCPVELRARLTAEISVWNPRFAVRIAHSMTEAWLMADREGFAEYFHVSPDRVPVDPEQIQDAKSALLSLCSRSSSRAIRRDAVSSDGQTGALYVVTLNEFASTRWNVEAAAQRSPSLARAVRAIRALA